MKFSHSKSTLHIVTLISLLISLIGGAVFVTPAHAAGFVVTKTADTADGTCDVADCSLREAIIAANAAAGDDTITIPAGTYTLTIAGTGENAAATGDLDITNNITINGAGADSTIIQAGTLGVGGPPNGIDRVFDVTAAFTVNISGVTVRNGNFAGYGGGIFNWDGTLTITNSTFSGNSATPGFAGAGGGIFNRDGTLTITNSTFSGNSADSSGGGIYDISGATLTITNSTFSGNSAASSGGGIYSGSGTLTITNSTISGNSAVIGGGIVGGGTVTLRNTIVANSTSGGNCFGTITDGGNNIDSAATCGWWGSTNGSLSSTNPLLGALANNGGPTQTFALLAGSPAIDGVTFNAPNSAPSTDQRGVARPMPIGGAYDIGAYEYREFTPPTVVFGAGSIPSADGQVLTVGPSTLLVQFSENVLSDFSQHSATSGWNYMLVRPGPNGVFDTTVTSLSICDSAHVAEGDDEKIDLLSITYDAVTFTATINIDPFFLPLANGQYRLYVCGAASIRDLSGNPLNGGANAAVNFTVAPAAAAPAPVALPATGFALDRVTVLPPQTVSYAAMGELWLEIPKLGVQMNIVGVPQASGEWDVSWLGGNAGWLDGSAFPTWAGNSVLTGHVWNADNTAGPFAYLNQLWWGDKIIVHAWGGQYVYEVRSVLQVSPGNVNAMLKHEELPWVTLVTCRGYVEASDSYKYRVLVRAVLVEVK